MRHCYVLRVFTREGEGGNHLGVVTDVSGLSDAVMQQTATDLGFSETIFIDWRNLGVPKVRIFTPARELPFAGHPLVGAAYVLNELGPGGCDQIECGIGTVSIGMDPERAWFETSLDQPVRMVPPTHGAKAANVVEMPIPYTLLEYGLGYEIEELDSEAEWPGMCYAWAATGENSVKARFFARDAGVVEDPATGSAATALAAVLQSRGQLANGRTIYQGEEVGFPSQIDAAWADGRVKIIGSVEKDEVRELDV